MSKKKSPQNSGCGETATGCGCLAVLALIGIGLLGSCVSDDEPTAKDPGPVSTATATATAKPEKLASQVGKHLNTAQNAAIKAGLTFTRYDASGQERNPARVPADWTVCFQTIKGTEARFGAVLNGVPCPAKPAKPATELTSEKDESDSNSGGSGDGQAGIEFGQHCAPVGALGTSWDGRPAECFMGRDGRPRWGYDSDRG